MMTANRLIAISLGWAASAGAVDTRCDATPFKLNTPKAAPAKPAEVAPKAAPVKPVQTAQASVRPAQRPKPKPPIANCNKPK